MTSPKSQNTVQDSNSYVHIDFEMDDEDLQYCHVIQEMEEEELREEATQDGVGSSSLTTWGFDQKAITLALCEMIIIDELPFRFVERGGFRRFMERLCPQFQIPSRITIRADCVKLFLEKKSSLKSFFQKKGFGRVSLTTSCWTAMNSTNFICVTANCISKDWKLHKKIISFKKIVSHKANDVGEAIVESLLEWGLSNILCCTVDNASTNDGAFRCVKSYLATSNNDVMGGKYLHMRCAANIFNLIVQDVLDEIGLSVRRVREAVKWVKATPARLAQFHEHANYILLDCKKMLSLDVPMRWNSTYLMLESAEPYEEVFKWLKLKKYYVDDLNKKKHNNSIIGPPNDDDWINVRKMIEYLKKFYDLTLLFSRTQYASSHLFFVELCDIFDLITDLETSDDIEVSSMATRMKIKIGKYWFEEDELHTKMNRLLFIAAVLDPRQKMKHVETCFRSLYEPQRATTMIREVTDSLNDLLEFYKSSHDGGLSQSSLVGTSRVVPTHGRLDCRGSLSLVALAAAGPDESYSELTEYLAEKQHRVAPEYCDQFDILKWWQTNSPRFPVLSEIARDVLAVPISSVPSEVAFSTGGRVLSPFRSSLSHSMVEALICSENWLKTSFVEKKDEEDVPDEELEQEFATVLQNVSGGGQQTTSAQSQSGQSGPS